MLGRRPKTMLRSSWLPNNWPSRDEKFEAEATFLVMPAQDF